MRTARTTMGTMPLGLIVGVLSCWMPGGGNAFVPVIVGWSIASTHRAPTHTARVASFTRCSRGPLRVASSSSSPTTTTSVDPPRSVGTSATSTSGSISTSSSLIHVRLSPDSSKPLGCTVEESLGDGHAVFVTSVQADGPAYAAGVRVGDVLVSASASTASSVSPNDRNDDNDTSCPDQEASVLWTDVTDVQQLMSLRRQCCGTAPLRDTGDDDNNDKGNGETTAYAWHWRLARGTTVLQEHEAKMVELCANPETDDEVEQCVLEFLQGGYLQIDEGNDGEEDEEECDPDAADCLVDDMYALWANDEDWGTSSTNDAAASAANSTVAAPKPWSTRASPSGTFVRDPATGKMTNIDV